jgi:hypothetical protein
MEKGKEIRQKLSFESSKTFPIMLQLKSSQEAKRENFVVAEK